jgi:NADH-quinone oxidoreductase subunit M
MLWMFQRVNYGPVTNEKNASLADLRPREWLVIVPIIAVAVLMGVVPNLFLRPIEPSVERILNQYHHGAPSRIQASAQPSRLRSPETQASFGEARRSATGAQAAALTSQPLAGEAGR